jgi:hypothetical protein
MCTHCLHCGDFLERDRIVGVVLLIVAQKVDRRTSNLVLDVQKRDARTLISKSIIKVFFFIF